MKAKGNFDADDPVLTEFYERKLLIPGWAGELSVDELVCIKSHLKADRRLRASWGMGRGTGKINDEKIRMVAIDGPEALQSAPSEDLKADLQLRFSGEKDLAGLMVPSEEICN